MGFLKVIGWSIIAIFFYWLVSFYKTTVEVAEYSQEVIPVLDAVSQDWGMTTVAKYIDFTKYKSNVAVYKSMLAKSVYLGAFENCSTLHFVDKDKRLAKTKILKGDCLFSNGQAQVIFFLFIQRWISDGYDKRC